MMSTILNKSSSNIPATSASTEETLSAMSEVATTASMQNNQLNTGATQINHLSMDIQNVADSINNITKMFQQAK